MRNALVRCVVLMSLVSVMAALLVVGCGQEKCQSDAECTAPKTCVSGVCAVAEGGSEGTTEPPSGDGGVPTCPRRCTADRDCVFCGDRKICDTDLKECVDIRVQCPKICNQDQDCTKPGCGASTTCNTNINQCVELIEECPEACTTDADCKAGGCGPRNTCSKEFGTCVDPTVANCPFVCQTDDGCKDCGTRNKCSFNQPGNASGICREFGSQACPTTCRSTGDCFTSGCGDKLFCNYALGQCVTKDNLCPTSCKADADCATNCGTRNYCYKSSPDRDGFCTRAPTATTCPATCNSSFSCKARECGERSFCNFTTNACVTAADACPGNCTTDADCPKDKCGSTAECRNGRCLR